MKCRQSGNIRADETIEFNVFHAGRQIKGSYRRVKVWLEDKQEELVLLTNLHDLGATTIAAIYKQRWQIELFFKAIKQNLKIKTFVGTSANAVRIQIWTALIAIVLMKLLQFRSRLKWALSNLVALLRWNLFAYRDLWAWIDDPYSHPPEPGGPCSTLLLLGQHRRAMTPTGTPKRQNTALRSPPHQCSPSKNRIILDSSGAGEGRGQP